MQKVGLSNSTRQPRVHLSSQSRLLQRVRLVQGLSSLAFPLPNLIRTVHSGPTFCSTKCPWPTTRGGPAAAEPHNPPNSGLSRLSTGKPSALCTISPFLPTSKSCLIPFQPHHRPPGALPRPLPRVLPQLCHQILPEILRHPGCPASITQPRLLKNGPLLR